MKESNAGSLMELLTNTMDWGEALARAMTVNRDSANMNDVEALKLLENCETKQTASLTILDPETESLFLKQLKLLKKTQV